MVLLTSGIVRDIKADIPASKHTSIRKTLSPQVNYFLTLRPERPLCFSVQPLLRLLFLFEQSHNLVDRVLLLLLLSVVLIAKLILESALQEPGGQALHIWSEFWIGGSSRDSKWNSHAANLCVHLEGKLIVRINHPATGEHPYGRNGEVDVVGLRALRRHFHIRTEVLNGRIVAGVLPGQGRNCRHL